MQNNAIDKRWRAGERCWLHASRLSVTEEEDLSTSPPQIPRSGRVAELATVAWQQAFHHPRTKQKRFETTLRESVTRFESIQRPGLIRLCSGSLPEHTDSHSVWSCCVILWLDSQFSHPIGGKKLQSLTAKPRPRAPPPQGPNAPPFWTTAVLFL